MKRKRNVIIISSSSVASPSSEDGAAAIIKEDPIEEELVQIKRITPPAIKEQTMLIDKYHPTLASDLAVHKQKISKVRDWFRKAAIATNPSILLLSGPVGAGKTATVRCLAKEFNLKLEEWENEINTNSFGGEPGDHKSVINGFTSAIKACSLVRGLQLHTSSRTNLIQLSVPAIPHKTCRKILLMEDLPNVSVPSSRLAVHNALQNYLSFPIASSSIIIIISDAVSPSSSFNTNDMPISKRSFISPEILASPLFSEISFNPIAKTLLIKALMGICQNEAKSSRSSQPKKQQIEDIAIACGGDLRKAINYMQFHGTSQSALQMGKLKQDESSLFSALGKLLYNKREEFESDGESQLVGRNSHFKRHCLSFDPEKLFDLLQMDASSFNLFLNQNYTSHCATLSEAVSASEYLSLADVLNGPWDSAQTLNVYAASVGSRGLLMSWDPSVVKKSSFSPLNKPAYWSCATKKRENTALWKEVCHLTLPEGLRSHSTKSSDQFQLSRKNIVIDAAQHDGTAFLELLPFLGIFNRSNGSCCDILPTCDRDFLFKLTSYQTRTSLSLLTEKDDTLSTNLPQQYLISKNKADLESSSLAYIKQLKRLDPMILTLADDEIEEV